jgi:uncharacterized protein (DUF2141 family)
MQMVQTICLSVVHTIKMVLAFVLPLFYFSPVFSQAKISVQVTNFSNNKGSCIICLYNSAAEFADNGTPVACATVAVNNKTTTTSFTNVAPGTYAILVIHDANNNRKFDTNFLGIPKEGYGASGNKLPFAAAPKFEDNKFTVTDGAALQSNIKLRYIF